ncbi:hypothetical protein AB0D29_20825 [Streptomyces sp. NPDC048424]|uniref:hypothetical protein n=1 Tax=Streptomyces sp. NPDC048424 TaxID=3155265 RepID=UPI00343DFC10
MGLTRSGDSAPGSVAQGAALPAVGVEVSTDMAAVDVPLQVDSGVFTFDLRGRMRQRVEADPEEPNPTRGVRLRTIGFHLEGTSADGTLRVTFDLDGADAQPASRLRVQQAFPPVIRETDVLPLAMTLDKADQPPLTLHSASPAVLTATLRAFPPQGDDYQLQNPVDFVTPGSDTRVARLQGLSLKRGATRPLPQ